MGNTGEIMASDRLQSINYARMREYRLNRTKEMMKKHGIGTLVTWDAWDIRYISSAYVTIPTRWFENQFLVLPINGDPYVYAATSFSCYAMREEMPWLKDKIFPSPGVTKVCTTENQMENVIRCIEQIVRDHGLENDPIGLDGCTSELLVTKTLAQKGLKTVEGKHCMFEARMIKNRDEVECVRMACSIADAAFTAIKHAIKPGVRECELLGIGMERLYALGCDETQEFVVASSPRSNPLHIDFTDRLIRPGDCVCVDINGASWMGYKSCYYRTFVCGKASPKQHEIFAKSRAMMYDSMSYVKAGVPLTDMFKGWPDSPEAWGYEKNNWADVNCYAVAHGVGLSLHEFPVMQYMGDCHPGITHFEEGMVIAVETWYGDRGGKDGVRLEENILVTKGGYELLTQYPVDKIIECEI